MDFFEEEARNDYFSFVVLFLGFALHFQLLYDQKVQ